MTKNNSLFEILKDINIMINRDIYFKTTKNNSPSYISLVINRNMIQIY